VDAVRTHLLGGHSVNMFFFIGFVVGLPVFYVIARWIMRR
jgi:hypothetical protein